MAGKHVRKREKVLMQRAVQATSEKSAAAVAEVCAVAERKGYHEFVSAILSLAEPARPVPLLDAMRPVFAAHRRKTVGKHRVYAVFLTEGKQGRCGVYIGQTSDDQMVRYLKHKTGNPCLVTMGFNRTSSLHVFKRGAQLLPELTAHLDGLSCCEALEVEQRLIRELRRLLGPDVDVEGFEAAPKCKLHPINQLICMDDT